MAFEKYDFSCLNCIHFDVCDEDRRGRQKCYGNCSDYLNDSDIAPKSEIAIRVIDEFKELAKTYLLNLDFYPVAFKNAMSYAETNLKKKYVEDIK